MKKKNFEEFSMIMNDNAVIDAPKQEGAVTMPTVPKPNGAIGGGANMLQVPNGAIGGGAVGAGLNLPPVPTQGFIKILDSFNKRIGTQPPYANNQFNLGSGTVEPMQPSTPNTGAVTQDQIREMANKVWESLNTDSGKLDYDAWRAEYGIDTDAEFNAAKAQLEYEMATWRENYGANAERLAQMGLSNSGVVDIYGTGVIQAYAQSMNDLFLAKIDAENAQLDRYKAYSDEYENKKAQATAAKNASINQAYAYGLGIYNGDNLESVRTMIANAGYAPDEVEAAVARLQAVDPSMLPTLQEQAAADKQNVQTAFNSLAANYTPEQADGLRKIYGEGMGWSEESVNSLISMLNGYAETKSATEEASKPSEEQIINDAASRLLLNVFTDEEGNVIYSGSQTQKNHIRQLMALSEYKDLAPYVDQIIAQMDADYASRKSAAATDTASDIEKIDTKNITFDAIGQELEAAALQYGADSEEYKAVFNKTSAKMLDAYTGAITNIDDFDAAYNLIGVSAEDWDDMEDDDKLSKIIDSAGDARKDGLISSDDFMSLLKTYVSDEMTKNNDLYGFSNVAVVLAKYNKEGVITLNEYSHLTQTIIDRINFESIAFSKAHGRTYVTLETAKQGGVLFEAEPLRNQPSDDIEKYSSVTIGTDKLYLYENDIYLNSGESWHKLDYSELSNTDSKGEEKNEDAILKMLRVIIRRGDRK